MCNKVTPLVKEIVFSPLYILASFVEDKVSIGAWMRICIFNKPQGYTQVIGVKTILKSSWVLEDPLWLSGHYF